MLGNECSGFSGEARRSTAAGESTLPCNGSVAVPLPSGMHWKGREVTPPPPAPLQVVLPSQVIAPLLSGRGRTGGRTGRPIMVSGGAWGQTRGRAEASAPGVPGSCGQPRRSPVDSPPGGNRCEMTRWVVLLSSGPQPHASTACLTDRNRPQRRWQPPPSACLTASGTFVEAPALLMHP